MRVLVIAPVPPPVTGHSLVSQVLVEDLARTYDVDVVNLSSNFSTVGKDRANRVAEVFRILGRVWKKQGASDVIYFTISESFAGNIKDLLIYVICRKHLSRMYVH